MFPTAINAMWSSTWKLVARSPFIIAALLTTVGWAQQSQSSDLSQASLEDLMNIQVTSVSKKEQKLSKTGAAIFVITQEDIKRSGATNIPDVLRLAPGVDVAQINANTWAISIRGFNDLYANKVLVLIDGRSVYSPNFSGVNWDEQDVPLEDIDRIEVIRGPGGTIWGANAINGVINIITKSSKATQGGLISAYGGSQARAGGLLQYGDKLGQDGAFRIFADHSNVGELNFPNDSPAGDGWHLTHGGFRGDWDLTQQDSLTVQGDLIQTNGSQTITTLLSSVLPIEQTLGSLDAVNSGDLLGHWRHVFDNGSEASVQLYYDRDERRLLGIHDILNTVDLDVSHHFTLGSRNDIVWGFGYRFTQNSSTPGYAVSLLPLYPTDNLANAFLQDEIALTPSLSLTLGSKIEHNTYTGLEYEPSAQLVWDYTDRQAFWVSAARAIRQPARLDGAIDIDYGTVPLPGGSFALLEIVPNTHLQAEELRDFESGYRVQINDKFSFDLAAFFNLYSSLRTQEPATPYYSAAAGTPYMIIPLLVGNEGHGQTYGGEIFANWNLNHRWRLSSGYSLLHTQLWLAPRSQDQTLAGIAVSSPKNQFQVRSLLNLTHRLDWDSTLAYVGILENGGLGSTPAYTRLDTRFGYRIGESVEFSMVGQNLLTPQHLEFHWVYPTNPVEIQRSVFARITWRF